MMPLLAVINTRSATPLLLQSSHSSSTVALREPCFIGRISHLSQCELACDLMFCMQATTNKHSRGLSSIDKQLAWSWWMKRLGSNPCGVLVQWLEWHLEGIDRCITPWLVVGAHRPMYVVHPHKSNRIVAGQLNPTSSACRPTATACCIDCSCASSCTMSLHELLWIYVCRYVATVLGSGHEHLLSPPNFGGMPALSRLSRYVLFVYLGLSLPVCLCVCLWSQQDNTC